MNERIQIPPIRTGLEDPEAANGRNAATDGRTAKEWYYFWRQSADQLNAASIKLDGLVAYGKHADRPDPKGIVPVPDGALYLEQDRGSAFYQFQDGKWMYIAGTMWSTLSPDQRPADLTAPNDIGFEFWATDQTPVRKYVWSGSAWIEQTPALYGTHAARLALTPANIALGVLYVETDRNNVIYEMQKPAAVNVWVYVTGTMSGTISPDQRPADLGANDTGFQFQTTDTLQQYRWTGSAWVETPAANDVQQAFCSSNLTLTTTSTAIPGTTLTLNRKGRYLITGNFTFLVQDVNIGCRGQLIANGVNQGGAVVVSAFNSIFSACSQQWIYPAATAGQSVYLAALKDGGTGSSLAAAPQTSITALWISP
jgi:hypothetical protein